MQIISKALLPAAAIAALSPAHAQAPTSPPTEAEIRKEIYKGVGRVFSVEEEDMTDDAHFVNDFGLDSLDAVEIVMRLEDRFFISLDNEDVENAFTVRDMINAVMKQTAQLADKKRIKYAGYELNGVEVGTQMRKGKSWQGLYREKVHTEIIAPKFAKLDGLIFTDYQVYRATKQNGLRGLVGLDGRVILKPKFQDINGVPNNTDYVLCTDPKGRHALFRISGELVLEKSTIEPLDVDPSGRFIKARTSEGQTGIMDLNGEWLVEPEWTDILFPGKQSAGRGFCFFLQAKDTDSTAVFQFKDDNLQGDATNWNTIMVFDYRTNRYLEISDRMPDEVKYHQNITTRDNEGNWNIIAWDGSIIVPPANGEFGSRQVFGYYDSETKTLAVKHYLLDQWGIVDLPNRKLVANFIYDSTLPYKWKNGRKVATVYDFSGKILLDIEGNVIKK